MTTHAETAAPIIGAKSAVLRAFGTAAMAAGLDEATATVAAKHVASGDLAGMLLTVPMGSRGALHAARLAAFADGFGAASLLAAIVALVACLLIFALVSSGETAPSAVTERPRKFVDYRNPL